MTPLDVRRLIWRRCSAHGSGSWAVRYVDSFGQMRVSTKGLQVPRMSLGGEAFSEEDAHAAALQVMKKAKREWNRLDLSDEDRFDV